MIDGLIPLASPFDDPAAAIDALISLSVPFHTEVDGLFCASLSISMAFRSGIYGDTNGSFLSGLALRG